MYQFKRKICSEEDCSNPVWSKGRCKYHHYRENPPKKLKAVKDPKARDEKIAGNREYYKKRIFENLKKFGTCKCEECKTPIKLPTGRNVAHIISYKADSRMYHDLINSWILGKGEMFGECNCGDMFDNNKDQVNMDIWAETQERKTILKNKYNANNKD